jgi:hypothetical protein
MLASPYLIGEMKSIKMVNDIDTTLRLALVPRLPVWLSSPVEEMIIRLLLWVHHQT